MVRCKRNRRTSACTQPSEPGHRAYFGFCFFFLALTAIPVRGGQCVRLRQGDYQQKTVFSSDPAATARKWVEQGATYLHLVDLDGAREGRPINGESVRRIVETAGVSCQLGGGLRNEEQ